jgi:hypothetical protein
MGLISQYGQGFLSFPPQPDQPHRAAYTMNYKYKYNTLKITDILHEY